MFPLSKDWVISDDMKQVDIRDSIAVSLLADWLSLLNNNLMMRRAGLSMISETTEEGRWRPPETPVALRKGEQKDPIMRSPQTFKINTI